MKHTFVTLTFGLALCACLVSTVRAESDAPPKSSSVADRPLEWVWLNGEAGFAMANLRTFNANSETLAVGIVPTAGNGPTAGIGAGFRVVFVTLGLRGRVASLYGEAPNRGSRSFQLWTLDAEAGVRVPLHRFEPNFSVAFGYASLGGLGAALDGLRGGLDVSGANLRVGAGLEYYLTRYLTVGVNFTGEVLALARKGVALRDLAEAKRVGTIDEAQARILEGSGSSVGTVLALTLGAGLHF